MSELQTLQRRFRVALLEPPGSAAPDSVTAGRTPSRSRLDVYRTARHIRLQSALAHDFPAVHRQVGDGFGRLAHDYLVDHPSTHPSLRQLGAAFPGWLASVDALLAELARLEWALLEANDAADANVLRREDLVRVGPADWPQLVFRLHPSVTLLRLEHGAWAGWVQSPQTSGIDHVLVWRAHSPRAVRLPAAEWLFLNTLGADARWDAACLAIEGDAVEVPVVAARYLMRALDRGLFISPR